MLNSTECNSTSDLNVLSLEDFEVISANLSENLQKIFLTAKAEADRLMKPYGLEVQVALDVSPIETALNQTQE